ncbi:MAG: divalent-cation tolerance protein CutA [Gammaproteobacteria bacterium]
MPSHAYLLVMTTCPDQASAERLARALVESRRAACVHVLPAGTSYYRWQEALETGVEHTLLIKTRDPQYRAVEHLIREHHPYEVPEVIAVPLTYGDQRYLAWIDQNVSVEQ